MLKELDVIIDSDRTIYPIKIKKSTVPKVEMVKNFKLLNKATGYQTEIETKLCLVEEKRYVKDDIIAYTINGI